MQHEGLKIFDPALPGARCSFPREPMRRRRCHRRNPRATYQTWHKVSGPNYLPPFTLPACILLTLRLSFIPDENTAQSCEPICDLKGTLAQCSIRYISWHKALNVGPLLGAENYPKSLGPILSWAETEVPLSQAIQKRRAVGQYFKQFASLLAVTWRLSAACSTGNMLGNARTSRGAVSRIA